MDVEKLTDHRQHYILIVSKSIKDKSQKEHFNHQLKHKERVGQRFIVIKIL